MLEKCPNMDFFPGAYFPAFGLNTGKYGPEKTVHAVHSLAHGAFSSPKTGQSNSNFLSSYKNLITLHVNFYGWLVKVIISKSMNFFCYHIFREEN